ncbi:hypothetical protein [Nitrosospira multiformis]|uniref:hypothetical protein n=1 Tax=Nitrosospira multiformis TaxID=1231 RepID=UPI00210C552F|nr:hypothetical protein [Nitrosospira multiformis]
MASRRFHDFRCATLYIDGKAAGEARDAVLPAGSVTLGGRFKGEMDEAQVSGLAGSRMDCGSGRACPAALFDW